MDGTPFGRYRLVELLGRGGMGEVWKAHDVDTDRIVALKLLPPHLSEDEDFQRRFRREAHAAARLNNPHVIPIHNYGEIDGRLYVDMRLIEGRDLQTVLTDGPMEPARAVRIIDQVANALHAAHRVGLLHRDIKPSNILLDHDDFAYLIDFGIARVTDETRMTKTGNTIGTFAYIAPERLDPHMEEDARADIYSLACVLYEALTGEPPFAGTTTAHLIAAHLSTPPPRPSTNQPEVPPQIDEVIATGMAKDPDRRYATTIELAHAARDAITVPIARPTASPAFLAATQAAGDHVSAEPPLTATQQAWPPAPQPEPADQPPPAAASSPWWRRYRLGLIAATVVILAAAGTTGYLLRPASPGAQKQAAQPSTTNAPTITTPSGPPPVAQGELQGLLLYPDQIDTAVGTSGMTLAGPKYPTSTYDDTDKVADMACMPLEGPAEKPVYAGSGWTALSGQELHDQNAAHQVEQEVVLFPSAQAATAFFTASAQQWPACANRSFNFLIPGSGKPAEVWTVGPVSNTDGTLSATKTIPQGFYKWRSCQRALTVANNVAIDVRACSYNRSDAQSNAAVIVAHQIAAKVPTK